MEQKYYKIKTIQYDDNMTFFYFNICPNGDKQTAVFVSNENYPIIKSLYESTTLRISDINLDSKHCPHFFLTEEGDLEMMHLIKWEDSDESSWHPTAAIHRAEEYEEIN